MGREDAELVARWQRGDADAFEALVRRWEGPIARFLARLVGPGELVADLCQEVFLRAYHAGARYRPMGAFSTWLYRIALNVARDAARRGRRRPVALAGAEEVPDRGQSAEAICQERELAGAVAQALAELPEPLRVVLVLRHYEGMSFEEMGRLTGTPASTLKSRFAAALGRLRVRMQQLGWGPEESER
jgi:RNA polymerase sigma-70 factor, ECF subfamily